VANGIPVVRSDRGGDITYHGPGQVVLYALVDLARRGIKVKRYVWLLEQCVIDLVGRGAERRPGAPGVYVDGAKIAALGIRVVRGRAYHGLALNVDMDLAPFSAIDPCGYPGLKVTRMRDLGFLETKEQIGLKLSRILIEKLDA
jgi:lipoyl(octanoyl) transferase